MNSTAMFWRARQSCIQISQTTIPSEAVPRTDASYRLISVTRSPTNLRSVPVAEDLTHL